MSTSWTPEQLKRIAYLLKRGHSYSEIGREFNAVHVQIKRAAHRHKLLPDDRNMRIRHPVPADFVEKHAEMSYRAMGRHYGFSPETCKRMARKLGVYEPRPKPVAKPVAKRSPHRLRNNAYMTAPRAPVSQAVMNEAGRAAEYLRPDYVPVYRCDQDGKVNAGGRWWRCGTRVFSDAQIIERAAEVKARRERMRAA